MVGRSDEFCPPTGINSTPFEICTMSRLTLTGRTMRLARLRTERLDDRIAPASLSHFLTNQHVDLNVNFAAGNPPIWNVLPTNDDAGVVHQPDDALLYVGQDGKTSRPSGSEFDFIGIASGTSYYRLPQSQDTRLIYLGIGGGGIPSQALDRYNPSVESLGRVAGQARWAKMRLDNVKHVTTAGTTGNGIFSVWQSGDSGPVVFMSNFNDNINNPNGAGLDTTDGITANDALWITTGGHHHFNYGFSQTGRYEVTVRLSGYLDDGNTTSLGTFVESTPVTLFFSVGSVGQLNVDPASLSVNESAGNATLTVNRTGGSDGKVTVNYATTSGTAIAGSDFTATTGTLTFADGQTSATISVPIINDASEEGDESFTVVLSQPGPASIQDYLADFETKSLLGTWKTSTVTILANDTPGPNQPPTIGSIADQSMSEDGFLSVSFTVGDDFTPLDDLGISVSSSNPTLVPNSQLTPAGSGAGRTLGISPLDNAFGTAMITITVTDGGNLQASRTFNLAVVPTADTPSATGAATLEDQQSPMGPTILRNPVDGPEVTHIKIEAIQNGLLFKADGTTLVPVGAFVTIAEAPAMKFTPADNLNDATGTTFGYSFRAAIGATDAGLAGETAFAKVTVTPVNDIPAATIMGDVAVPQNAGVVTKTNYVTAFGPGGGSDEAAQNLSFVLTSSNGSLFTVAPAIDSTGTLTFTIADGVSGESNVTLDVRDSGGTANGGIDTRSFAFVIRVAVNSPPVANDNNETIANTQSIVINVLSNDTDLDGDPLNVTGFTPAVHGTVTQVGNQLKYVPNPAFVGQDSFTYSISDGQGGTDSATVFVDVTQGNRAPVAVNDAMMVMPGGKLFGNVLRNDFDPDANPLSVSLLVGPAKGSVSLQTDGSFQYVPVSSFDGTDSFTYTLSDGQGGMSTGTVTLTGRAPITGFANVFSEGDVDLAAGFEDGSFEPHIHDEENELEVEPADGVYHLRPEGASTRPAGASFDFIGVPAGQPIYRFSQTLVPELLYLGFGTEELAEGTFVGDEIRVRYIEVDGPGHVSIWNSTDSGPVIRMATSDGLNAMDTLNFPVGSHTHSNWGFTARGLYAITLEFEGVLQSDGTTVVSAPATFFFAVDPVNSAPTISAPATITTAYQTDIAVSGVSIGDADTNDRTYQIAILAATGAVTLMNQTGLTFLEGDGTSDTVIRATGSLAAINASLSTLRYRPAAGFFGNTSLAMTITDGGVLVGENALSADRTVGIAVSEPIRNRFAAGSGQGSGAWLYNADSSVAFFTQPFGASWTGGVRVAAADMTGDGVEDLVVATGPGGVTRVIVLDGKAQTEIFSIQPFEDSFTGGLFVSAGDMNGDGIAEFVVSPDEGGGPRVQVYTGSSFIKRADYFGIDDPNFRGGARTAVGDLNSDGHGDLIVAAGFGGGPRVAAFSGKALSFDGGPKLFGDFFIFERALRNGSYVAAGDIDGDGFADLVAGAGPGGGPRVLALNGKALIDSNASNQSALANFFAGNPEGRRGVRVAVGDVAGKGAVELMTGSASKTTMSIYSIGTTGETLMQTIDGLGSGNFGVFVG